MTARRRSRSRPLAAFATRSPLHAFAVWLLRTALIVGISLLVMLVVFQVLIPAYITQVTEQVHS